MSEPQAANPQPQATQHELAARPLAPAPEADVANHETRPAAEKPEGLVENRTGESLMPPPLPTPKAPPQAASGTAEAPANHEAGQNRFVSEEARKAAEEALAQDYFPQKLKASLGEADAAALSKDLELTLKELTGHGKSGLELCFKGPALSFQSALLGEEIVKALQEHPAFAPLFHEAHSKPHWVKPHEPGKEDMVHVQVPNLEPARLRQLIDGIGQRAASAPAENVAQGPQHSSEAKSEAADTVAAPQNIVQAPVAALDKIVANDNELQAPQGAAR